jgi:hypothetical protein
MRIFKFIAITVIVVIICVVIGNIYLKQSASLTAIWDRFIPKGEQSISIQALQPKRADKLFTGFVYIPIIHYKKEDDNKTIKGVCSREYTVDIGYNDTLKLFDQYHGAACKNDFQAMPNPTIIGSDFVEAEEKGDYSKTDCDSFDTKTPTTRKKSDIEILVKLNEDGQWNGIAENSKKILTRYLRIYCSEPVSK